MDLKISETTQDHSILRGFFRTLCEPRWLHTWHLPPLKNIIHFSKTKRPMISILFRKSFPLITLLTLSTTTTMMSSSFAQPSEPDLSALIIDGQNNHDVWPKSTIMMKQYLEETGLFLEVDVVRTKYTWKGKKEADFLPLAGVPAGENVKKPKTDPNFFPQFRYYDVVISNFGNDAAPWPEATKKSFESYMAGGGGFVTVHAADNSFGDWPEYNKMIGLGGWGGRDDKSGTYVYFNDQGKMVRDDSKGKVGGHGARNHIPITVRTEHPILNGLPSNWLSAKDECYAKLRGPAENMTVLATGKDTSKKGRSNRHEPMLMVLNYDKGRIFHTTLGHDSPSFEGVGFITTFTRGCEWAATGNVTLKVPEDFPSQDKSVSRKFVVKGKQSEEKPETPKEQAEPAMEMAK